MQYNSFKEIDEGFMVLKLQRKIEIESLIKNLQQAKSNLRPFAIGRRLKGAFRIDSIDLAIKSS